MKVKVFFITSGLVLLVLICTLVLFAQSNPPATSDQINNDKAVLQASIIDAFEKAATLEADVQSYTDAQLAGIVTQQQILSGELDVANGSITTVAGTAQQAMAEADAANNTAAAATLMATNFIDMFPCAILSMKVDVNTLGQRVLTFTTPTPCTAWATYSGQTGLQTTRATYSPIGTVTSSFDPTLATSFSYALITGMPVHGTIQVFTYDKGGTKTIRQIEY